MNIAPVSFNAKIGTPAHFSEGRPVMKSNSEKRDVKTNGIPAYPPAVVGIANGLCWGTVGYAFDKICSKLFGYKSSNKMSLSINGIIGAGMGIYSYVQVKKQGSNR